MYRRKCQRFCINRLYYDWITKLQLTGVILVGKLATPDKDDVFYKILTQRLINTDE